MRAALALLAVFAASFAAAAEVEIKQTRIADGIHQFTTVADGYVSQLNTVVIVNQRDVLVFDTNTRPSSARIILAEIRKLTDKPVRFVVNSHWHPDHWSGNEVFAAAFPDADIIATAEALEFMQNAHAAWPARFRMNLKRAREEHQKAVASGVQEDGSPYTPELRRKEESALGRYSDLLDETVAVRRTFPTLTYVDRLTLRHGGREFRFLSVAGDAEGTTVLYLPQEKVLITGDVLVHPIPYSTPAPTRRIRDLKMLAALDFQVIIPGHGPGLRDRAYLGLQIELLEAVVAQVRAALRQGAATFEEVLKATDFDALRLKFTGGDAELDQRFRGHVRNLLHQAIREAREQDYVE